MQAASQRSLPVHVAASPTESVRGLICRTVCGPVIGSQWLILHAVRKHAIHNINDMHLLFQCIA